MQPERIIALDLDGVVADFHQVVLDILNDMYHTSYTTADWTSWQFVGNALWRSDGAPYKTETEGRRVEKKIFRLAWDRWQDVPLQEPNAIQYANDLRKYGKVFLLTGRQGFVDDANVAMWCSTHGLKTHGFYCLDIDSGLSKPDFTPPFNVYIDDNPSTIIGASKKGALSYLPDRPWNQKVEESSLLKRVKSLKEVLDDLKVKTS